MPANDLLGSTFRVIGTAKLTIASPATTALDFGTPNDTYLPFNANGAELAGGERIVVVVTATTAGTTSTLTVVVQDADDVAGAIGTPATAITDGTLALGTADGFTVIGVRPQAGRPWLRVSITHATATDSFVVACMVLAVPKGI